jgi:hypothetical protein
VSIRHVKFPIPYACIIIFHLPSLDITFVSFVLPKSLITQPACTMFNRYASLLAAAVALPAMTLAAITPEMSVDERYLVRRALNVGMGTRYGDDCTEEDCWQGGACAFTDYTLPSSVDGSTCVSQDIWDSSAQCGGCISVTYKGKTITVMVCIVAQ